MSLSPFGAISVTSTLIDSSKYTSDCHAGGAPPIRETAYVCVQQFHGQDDDDQFRMFWASLVQFELGIMC